MTYPHLQLLKYLLKVWEINIKQGERLLPVIPVIFYHGKAKWKLRKFEEYFESIDEIFYRFIPSFEYMLTDLSTYSNEEIKNRTFKRVSLEISMLLMKNIFNEEELERNLKDFLEIGKNYLEQEEGVRFIESVIRYLSKTEIMPEKVINTIKNISERGGEFVMTMESILIERGIEKGRIEGLTKRLKEAIELGLELKYGVKGLKFYEKIVNITSIEKLEMIKEALKISKSLEEIEVFGD